MVLYTNWLYPSCVPMILPLINCDHDRWDNMNKRWINEYYRDQEMKKGLCALLIAVWSLTVDFYACGYLSNRFRLCYNFWCCTSKRKSNTAQSAAEGWNRGSTIPKGVWEKLISYSTKFLGWKQQWKEWLFQKQNPYTLVTPIHFAHTQKKKTSLK